INTGKKRAYISYRFPRYINDTLILAEKSGIDQINQFVLLDGKGNEKVVYIPGYYEPVRLSAGAGKIVWAETIYDVRWYNRSFSDIKIYDLKEGKEYRFTKRTRYFAPDISHDGRKIIAVRIDPGNRSFLDILNTLNGEVEQSFSLPGNVTFFKPTWKDDHTVLVIVLTSRGKSIRELDLRTGTWRVMVNPAFDDIQSVSTGGRYLFFHATYSGIDNIYALDTVDHQIRQVTRSRFGASDVSVSPDRKKIVYDDYTSNGYNLAELPVDPAGWIPFDNIRDMSLHLGDSLVKQEKEMIHTADIPDSVYPVSSYSKFTHLLKLHSWLPFYFDYDHIGLEQIPVYPGFVLYSQNYLSTLAGSLGYAYRNHEHQLITTVTYSGLYPVFKLMEEYGGTPLIYQDSTSFPLPGRLHPRNNFTLQVYVPLNLTTDRYDRGMSPSIDLQYSNSYIWSDQLKAYNTGRIFMSYRFYYYNLLKMGHRDIIPNLGFTVDMSFLHAPWDKEDYGSRTSLTGKLYLPGFMKHHALTLQAGYEKQNPARFFYLNQLSYPRGYKYWLSEDLTTLAAHYVFPVVYPDLSLGQLFYIPRLSGDLFYEMAKGRHSYNYQSHDHSENMNFQGYGGELTLDFNVFRIEFPFSLGFWAAYNPEQGRVNTGFNFSINVYGLRINRQQRPLLSGGPSGILR
ncbi:MAG: hypothetical protein GWP10_19975, partial [Nitrospiraceae bacterium]|nr:hypothetical protein [Nitrospiraceae bacterium]